MKRIIFILLLLLSFQQTCLGATFTEPKSLSQVTYDLRTPGEIKVATALVYIDTERKVKSFDELITLEKEGKIHWMLPNMLSFGYTPSRYWLKLVVQNNNSDSSEWVLEHQYPLIQECNARIVFPDGHIKNYKAGRLYPFKDRPIEHKNYLFRFSLKKGESATIYTSLASQGPVIGSYILNSIDGEISSTQNAAFAYGLYYGLLLAMVVYNLFLWIATRRSKLAGFQSRMYLYYVLYGLCFCSFHSGLSGIAYQYEWPNAIAWNNIAVFVLIPLSYTFLSLFMQLFLETKTTSRLSHYILNTIILLSIILAVWPLVHYSYKTSSRTGWFMFGCSLFQFGVVWLCRKSKNSKYFLLAFASILVANTIYAGRAIGWIKDSFFSNHFIQLGSIIEVFALAFALVGRIKRVEEESIIGRLKAEQEAKLKALEADKAIKEKELEAQQALAGRLKAEQEAKLKALESEQAIKVKELEAQQALNVKESIANYAAKIAHNMMSPLSTLRASFPFLVDCEENVRNLIRYSFDSLSDLQRALDAVRFFNGTNTTFKNEITCEFLPGLLELIVMAKKIELSHKDRKYKETLIVYDTPIDDFLIFASVNPSELRDLLSNLLNNAIYWTPDSPDSQISVIVKPYTDSSVEYVMVYVIDNGRGMSADEVDEIRRNQPKSRRPDGHGIGLKDAQFVVESWGGSFEIDSALGRGTNIKIKLPRAKVPEWCLTKLPLRPESKILVLDDDHSIHRIWPERLQKHPDFKDIQIIDLYDPALLGETIEKHGDVALFLMDHEFLKDGKNGIELIQEFNIAARSILVTSKWNDKRIIEMCEKLCIKILPKPMAGIVYFEVVQDVDMSLVIGILIDNMEGVRRTWEVAAPDGKRTLTFKSLEHILQMIDEIPRYIPVYVDLNLECSMSGLDVARRLRTERFTNITIVSGETQEKLDEMINGEFKTISGKSPPWLKENGGWIRPINKIRRSNEPTSAATGF